MKFLVLILSVGLAASEPLGIVASQYRVQDELGNVAFGHAGGPNSREEVRAADGTTRGAYSYIDGHGLVQSAVYAADGLNGFRIAATDLPVGPAVPSGPAVVAATPSILAARGLIGSPLLAHHLGKRDLVAVQHLTSYPGSTAPLVAPVIATAPVIAARSLVAHPWSSIVATHGLAGVTHVLKKRQVWASPLVAGIHPGALNVPLDTPEVAITKAAQLIQQRTEGTRNILGGGIPLALPADTHEVAAGKIAHSIAHANQVATVSHPWAHILKKRSVLLSPYAHGVVASPFAAPIAAIHPGALNVPLDTPEVAATKAAQLIQQAEEGTRNIWGGIPVHQPADTPAVAITKTAQLIQQAEEGARNIWGSIPVHQPADTPAVAITKTAQLIQQASEGTRNILGGGIPVTPADTPEVAAGKAAHAIAHANEALLTGHRWKRSPILPLAAATWATPLIAPHSIISHHSVAVSPFLPLRHW